MTARTFVVVGASLTGATAVTSLRDRGFDGRLILIGDEPDTPYERPGLSKRYLRGEQSRDELTVRPPGWWQDHDVDVVLGTTVEGIDADRRTVVLAGGGAVPFDAALVATGVRNRRLQVPGADLDGIFQLRRVADADAIRERVSGTGHAVVVGMGFIGAEVAASLRTLGLAVTVVEVFETALFRVLGGELGRVVESLHLDHGVEVITGEGVDRFEGSGSVGGVRIRSGRTIACDLVVVGVGTEPNVEVMGDLGPGAVGGVDVDRTLRTSLPGVFAAGDVAVH